MPSRWFRECAADEFSGDNVTPEQIHRWQAPYEHFIGSHARKYGLEAGPRPDLIPDPIEWEELNEVWVLTSWFLRWAWSVRFDEDLLGAGTLRLLSERFPNADAAREYFRGLGNRTYSERLGRIPKLDEEGNLVLDPETGTSVWEPQYGQRSLKYFLKDCLFAHLAYQGARSACSETERAFDLLELISGRSLPPSVEAFARRIGRCYVAGLDAETIVMCRAVVENCIKQKLATEGIKMDSDTRFRQRVETARSLGFLSIEAAGDARTVWTRGSKAVHDDPTVVKDVLGTIALTMNVVEAIGDFTDRGESVT